MKSNLTAGLLLACALTLPPAARAQATDPGASLNMQNADIRAFIQDVGRATGTTFILDPRVQGNVSLNSDAPMSASELLSVLVALLRANGLVAVPSGRSVYRVVPDDSAARQPGSLGGQALGFTTRVFPLRHIDAKSAAEAVRELVGRGGVVVPSPSGNSLLVADYADNLRRLRELIARLDVDNSRAEVIRLRNSSAREIAGVIAGMYGGGGVTALPIETSNAVMLRGEPRLVAEVRGIVRDLDNSTDAVSDVRVVRLQHASAEEMLPVLQQVIGQQDAAGAQAMAQAPVPTPLQTPATGLASAADAGMTPPAGPIAAQAGPLGASLSLGPGRRARVARYPGANAIIINADPDTQRMLVDVIQQLDLRREQVLVEALVVEISDDAAKRLGSQLLIGGKEGSNIPFGTTAFPTPNRPGLLELAAGTAAYRQGDRDGSLVASAARSLLQYNGGLAGLAGETSNLIFGLIIDAVKNDSASNLLSTPSVLTLDNAEARILVGQEVPITTGEVLGGTNVNAFRTIQRQDVGVQLVVRPQINAGGGITLRLRQEVSAIAGPVSNALPELILNKREVETSVIADDGAIVVLGGLLDQGDRHTVDKVPVLGDIPVVGGLFRTTSRSRNKTNLMVFIRPTIVRDRADAARVTAPRYDYMRQQQLQRPGVTRAEVDALLQDYFRTTPPALPAPVVPPAPEAGVRP